MTIDNVYSYLEYLALTVDQLADAIMEREEESAVYETHIAELNASLADLQNEVHKAEARASLAEANAAQAQEKIQELSLQLKAAKQNKKAASAQIDLFSQPSAPQNQTPVSTKSHRVANDANALILAQKLDSTIDKVQKLIRLAGA